MMILMLSMGVLAASPQIDPAAGISDVANRRAAVACESALGSAAGGELQSISVKSASRTGSRTVLKGTIRVFLKPAPPPPGELSAPHIINARMHYQCRIAGDNVVKATVTPF